MAGRPKGLPKSGGRKKGTPNKVTASVREGLEAAFAGLGGVDHMTNWAKENPTEFYKLLTKLIPVQVTGEEGGPVELKISWSAPKKS